MHSVIHVVGAALLLLVTGSGSGCGNDQGRGPDAQQLARINKELAVLSARVDALGTRLDRLEQANADAATTAPETGGAAPEAIPPDPPDQPVRAPQRE